jgi:hypothetical protein
MKDNSANIIINKKNLNIFWAIMLKSKTFFLHKAISIINMLLIDFTISFSCLSFTIYEHLFIKFMILKFHFRWAKGLKILFLNNGWKVQHYEIWRKNKRKKYFLLMLNHYVHEIQFFQLLLILLIVSFPEFFLLILEKYKTFLVYSIFLVNKNESWCFAQYFPTQLVYIIQNIKSSKYFYMPKNFKTKSKNNISSFRNIVSIDTL